MNWIYVTYILEEANYFTQDKKLINYFTRDY